MAKLGARDVFMGQVRPGMEFDTPDDWVGIYESAAWPGSRLTPGRSR